MSRFARLWSTISRSNSRSYLVRSPRVRRQPTLECLEGRALMSTVPIAVTSLADSGAGTLRSAIVQANSGSKANTYAISFNVKGQISLNSVLPTLTGNVSIAGPGVDQYGSEQVIVDASAVGTANSYVFTVGAGANATISGIEIQGNYSSDTPVGGVNNFGFVELDSDQLILCSGWNGGAISNEYGGIAVVSGCAVDGNAGAYGGAIYNDGAMAIDSYNQAPIPLYED